MDGIEIEGEEKILSQLKKIGDISVLREPMYRAVLRLEARMSKYPNQRGGTKYRRTGSYGRRWTHKVTIAGGTITGKIGNNIEYGPYVGSAQFQNHIFSGQWITDVRALHEEERTIRSDFEQAINDLGKG